MGMTSTIEVSERLETLKELQAKQRNIKSEKRICNYSGGLNYLLSGSYKLKNVYIKLYS